ncbi:MAG: (2Fe-2S)-binding protein [Clostridiales bacterium]|uniref:(2Fe-2S)-binding protein n=1 Tax=Chordicoccus furentiruminis TaxID=2709410 RepID=UPI0023A904DF|nr:(2Fe-2S)-binding protein [Chordicoccus furentiruminis]MCI6173103.1 (2Fe-2S)-binding protein [Clostridiales bacterium]
MEDRDAVICECGHITRGEVIDAVLGGAMNFVDVAEATGAGRGCDRCRVPIEFLIQDVRDDPDAYRR